MQPELFELENQKDEVATHYVRLTAAVNSVDREVEAAKQQVRLNRATSRARHRHMASVKNWWEN